MFNQLFGSMPNVVKNLLILNILVFLAEYTVPGFYDSMSLYPFSSENFRPWQLVTHFFMHSMGSPMHIFFNMYALVLFGSHLEKVWGEKRFLIYYFATALGAALLHGAVVEWRIHQLIETMPTWQVEIVLNKGGYLEKYQAMKSLLAILNTPVIGASGAVFGILAGFAYLFPNTELRLLFPPIPIKAKVFVLVYAGIELYLGFANNPQDNVAHFAHLGGALVGFIMVYYWQKNKNRFY